jgi:hypothetical protein
MSDQLHALSAIFLRKGCTAAVGYETSWASEPSGRAANEKNPALGRESSLAIQHVATELLDSYQKQNV